MDVRLCPRARRPYIRVDPSPAVADCINVDEKKKRSGKYVAIRRKYRFNVVAVPQIG